MSLPSMKTLFLVLFLFFLCASVYSILLRYKKSYDSTAESMIKNYIVQLDEFSQHNKKYPRNLTELEKFDELKENVWKIFPSPKIYYGEDESNYRIYYYQFPVGPAYGFNQKSKEWFIEE